MVRVYSDSNIFRYIKPSHKCFSSELLHTFSDLQDHMLFIFSDAHLDDLSACDDQSKIDEDLAIMGKYCKDNYFSYSYLDTKKELRVYLASPAEAYASKNFEAADSLYEGNFNIDILLDTLDAGPEKEIAKALLKPYFEIPISSFGGNLELNSLCEQDQKYLESILPGLNQDMNISDFINCFMPYGSKLLFDIKEFTNLRKHSAQYINSNEFSYKKWGLNFNEKLKESPLGKTFLNTIDDVLIDSYKDDPLYRFTFTYMFLEIFGIVQERDSKNKLKKFSFTNLHQDATHAYYASHCDYLITDDKGLQVKAHIMYFLLGIETEILSSKDFINRRLLWLNNDETLKTFYKTFEFDLNNSLQVSDFSRFDTLLRVQEYKPTHNYFNYFNRYQLISNEKAVHAMFCKRWAPANFYIYREVELLISKLINAFGIDIEHKGVFDLAENPDLENNKSIRIWQIGKTSMELLSSKLPSGNYLVLTISKPNFN